MSGLDIDANGIIKVSYTNGQTKTLGKIMLATFANMNGLQQIGNADYLATATSGEPRLGEAGLAGFGSIKAGALEQSNVDVTDELVKLITSQRNFQASAKMIDTQKQLTDTLIGIR
jgi:flagellar hook protein FlgE